MRSPASLIGSLLLGVHALLTPQANGSSFIIIGVGGTPDYSSNYDQAFPGSLTLRPEAGASPLFLASGTIHIPVLQTNGSPALGMLATGSNGQFAIVDAANGNLFNFSGFPQGVPTPPPNPANFPNNRAPVGTDSTIPYPGSSSLSLLASSLASDPDGDQLSVKVVTKGKWGVLVASGNIVHYVPFGAYATGDSFTVELSDSHGGVTQSTVTLVNPLVPFAGSYSGVIGEIGKLNATLNRQGAGTVQLWANGVRYNGIVKFPAAGTAAATLQSSNSQSLNVSLELVSTTTPALRLRMDNEGTPIEADCPRLPREQFLLDYIGQYNAMVWRAGSSAEGYALIKVKPTGSVKLTGYLPNGRPWSLGAQVVEGGKVPIAILNRKGEPQFTGTLVLPPISQGLEAVRFGQIEWEHSSQTSLLTAFGGRFEPPGVPSKNIFGDSRTKFDFSIESPLITRRVNGVLIGGGQIFVPGIHIEHDDSTRLAIDGFNRVSQIKTGNSLTEVNLKRDGRFSGIYYRDGVGIPFHGLFYAPDRATGRLYSGRGSVSMSR